MRTVTRRLLVGLALAWTCACALAQPAAMPKRKAQPSFTHVLHLTAVKLEDSGWTDQRILKVSRGAGRILRQCGVKLERLELVGLVVPPRYQDVSTPVVREIARDYRVPRPAVYFVRDTRRSPPLEAEAFPRSGTETEPELADTVWITLAARDPEAALARELVHVLTDSVEHSNAQGNLLREQTSPGNRRLTAAQCARVRDTGTRNGLLKEPG